MFSAKPSSLFVICVALCIVSSSCASKHGKVADFLLKSRDLTNRFVSFLQDDFEGETTWLNSMFGEALKSTGFPGFSDGVTIGGARKKHTRQQRQATIKTQETTNPERQPKIQVQQERVAACFHGIQIYTQPPTVICSGVPYTYERYAALPVIPPDCPPGRAVNESDANCCRIENEEDVLQGNTTCVCPWDHLSRFSSDYCNDFESIICEAEILSPEKNCPPQDPIQPYGEPNCLTVETSSSTRFEFRLNCWNYLPKQIPQAKPPPTPSGAFGVSDVVQDNVRQDRGVDQSSDGTDNTVAALTGQTEPFPGAADEDRQWWSVRDRQYKTIREYRDSFVYFLNTPNVSISSLGTEEDKRDLHPRTMLLRAVNFNKLSDKSLEFKSEDFTAEQYVGNDTISIVVDFSKVNSSYTVGGRIFFQQLWEPDTSSLAHGRELHMVFDIADYNPPSKTTKVSAGLIIFIVVAVLVGILLVLALYTKWKRAKKEQQEEEKEHQD